MFNRKLVHPILLVALALLGLLLPYYLVFKGQTLSDVPNDWGAFGGYLAGIISVINLGVFIYISYLLASSDERRNRTAIGTQKAITLTQFRQSELEKLSSVLFQTLETQGDDIGILVSGNLMKTDIYLANFITQKSYLFPILSDSDFRKKYDKVSNYLRKLIEIVKKYKGNDLETPQREEIMESFLVFYKEQTLLLGELQKFVMDELNNTGQPSGSIRTE